MSAATKRKHVAREIVSEYPPLPNPPDLFICRIAAGRGNNLHLAEAALDHQQQQGQVSQSLSHFLVSMPTKFRKSVWVKRGDFVLCSPIEEGDKVKAEIVRVLYKEDIRYIRQQGKWPMEFDPVVDEKDRNSMDVQHDSMFPSSDEESEESDDGDEVVETDVPTAKDQPEENVQIGR